MENLNDYLNKLVCLTNGSQNVFGMLQAHGEHYAIGRNLLQTGIIKEMTKVEVDESRNLCRLVIKI